VTRGASARLFVAVDPPPETCAAMSAWARELPLARGHSMRVLDPGSLHLTLCFLGSRPVAEIDPIAGAVMRCSGPLGELRVGAPVLLPPRRPRALALEVHDEDGNLARLHTRLLAELAPVSDWQPEKRRLRPHITVARMRGGRRGGLPPVLTAPTPALAFAARSLVLYRSWLERTGARYEPLAESELGEGPERA
jgi:RNA 2',3'-cyclic 3'-phosphodiesterase